MICIGIDPGITGALGVLAHGQFAGVHDLPTMAAGKSSKVSNMLDPAGLYRLFREIMESHPGESFAVALEKPAAMPGQGVASMFSMGDSFGVIRGVVASLLLPVHFASPASWKRAIGVSSDKEQARAKAISLFPAAPLSRKKDHNRAESLLLAEWLRRAVE